MEGSDILAGRIVANPEVCHGKPRIKGTRIMVWQILDFLAEGKTAQDIISEDYPDITAEDIRACIAYANQYLQKEEVHPVPTSMSH